MGKALRRWVESQGGVVPGEQVVYLSPEKPLYYVDVASIRTMVLDMKASGTLPWGVGGSVRSSSSARTTWVVLP